MKCLSEATLDALASGELSADERAKALQHVADCESCRSELRELLQLYRALQTGIDAETCPDDGLLASFADGNLAGESQTTIEEHLARCARCSTLVAVFSATKDEMEREKESFDQAVVEARSRHVAGDVLGQLLPAQTRLLDQLWSPVAALVSQMRSKEPTQWPKFRSRGELAGALGFAGSPEPEVVAAASILATVLWTVWAMADGRVEARPPALATFTLEAAKRFGSGRQLAARLSRILGDRLASE